MQEMQVPGESDLISRGSQGLRSPLESLQVLHHLLHVLLGVTVLDIGKPAATHTNNDRYHQHEVLEVVMAGHCQRGRAQ